MNDQTTPAEVPAPNASETGTARRDTVVLSEVPDATTLSSPPAELCMQDEHRGSDPRSGHSSGALAVLSQRYHILGEVGRGDLCIVYKAHDKETGSTVALKLLRSDVSFDPATLERFKSDVLLASGITHPNICRVYDVHLLNGTACVSMHFAEGESLRSLLDRVGSLPLRKGIDLTLQICAGLAEAHGFGIVHGDLKPENVMIDPHGTAKITDFLFAPLLRAVRRLTRVPSTASPYTAPERADSKPLDRRADIYSLGVLLHEIFTGKLPVSTRVRDEEPSKQGPERPALSREVDAAIPVSLERVILKCLDADPAKRYQTVAELESDLSSSGIRAILPSGSGVGTRTTLANREAIAHPDAVPLSTPRPQLRSFSIHPGPLLGILLGVIVIIAMLGAFHVTSILRSARSVAAPSGLPAPKPPVFAPEKSTAAPASSRSQPASVQVPAFDEIPTAPATSEVPDAFSNSSGAHEIAPPGAAKPSSQGPTDRDAGAESYLWIGRFELQTGAQAMANKIEGFGFPAVIVPRRNPKGDFFVVLSGPFSPSKASGALDELQTDGFADIHVIKNLTLDQ